MSTAVDGLDLWWEGLLTASLVGTARRDVPPLPAVLGVAERPDLSREAALLEAAALGDAVRRAGAAVDRADAPDEPAPAETREPAPAPAVQVLELLLTQGPVAAHARDLLTQHWLESAAAAGKVVPPRLLPALLELGSTRPAGVRRAFAAAVGERGAWLAARNPAWHWLAVPEVTPDAGATGDGRATDPLAATLALRRADPAAGRSRIEETWATDGAQARAAAIAMLAEGLSHDDEGLLERALDDKARPVREEAARLLGRLPRSARAERMTARLGALLSVTGTLRRTIEIELPDDPDAAALRDGLTEAPKGVSRRGHWLHQIVQAAPLVVWIDLVRGDPAKVIGMLRGEAAALLPALRDAAAAQRDVAWARALLPHGWDSRLVALLPADEADRVLADRVGSQTLSAVSSDVLHAPVPWGPRLSRAVLDALGRPANAHSVRVLRNVLPTALHPSLLSAVQRTMDSAGDDTFLRTTMRDVLQYQSLHRSISEAFR